MEIAQVSTQLYPFASFCPETYQEGRTKFIEAAKRNRDVSLIHTIPIQAKGPNNLPLSIDIAIQGNLKAAKNILFHISATHGVEGFCGSGIQQELLTNSISLPADCAIIFVHTLNPFGMAWNRRTNENNIDLNRNCTEERTSPSLYPEIDAVLNPKKWEGFNQQGLEELNKKYTWPAIRQAIVQGQYSHPEGLFYGGQEIAEGPKLFLEWCENLFNKQDFDSSKLQFVIIDVHTGLGPYAVDTLLTTKAPTEKMLQIFGEKMSAAMQTSSVGYKVKGEFITRLSQTLQKVTQCSEGQISLIAQEFGARKESEVLHALCLENSLYHQSKRDDQTYDPCGLGGGALRHVFSPKEDDWKHQVVLLGRELVQNSFKLFLK